MCNSLWECIKCPGKVVCCCCECACKMLLSIFCSGIVLIIVIGLIVYFTVFYSKDSDQSAETAIQQGQKTFKDYFTSVKVD